MLGGDRGPSVQTGKQVQRVEVAGPKVRQLVSGRARIETLQTILSASRTNFF